MKICIVIVVMLVVATNLFAQTEHPDSLAIKPHTLPQNIELQKPQSNYKQNLYPSILDPNSLLGDEKISDTTKTKVYNSLYVRTIMFDPLPPEKKFEFKLHLNNLNDMSRVNAKSFWKKRPGMGISLTKTDAQKRKEAKEYVDPIFSERQFYEVLDLE